MSVVHDGSTAEHRPALWYVAPLTPTLKANVSVPDAALRARAQGWEQRRLSNDNLKLEDFQRPPSETPVLFIAKCTSIVQPKT